MNWGYKIIAVYVLFVAGIVFLVIKSSMENTDLVTSDYYEKELKYQQTIEQQKRASQLSSDVKINVKDHTLEIVLPEEMNRQEVKADVLLYCASDKRKDIHRQLDTKNAILYLPIQADTKGSFDVKLNWTANGNSFYSETKLLIP
jgi:hypothetical protein